MRTTILDLLKMKKNGQRIPMVTAYDATGAHWVEQAGIDVILVGDSLGMVVQGHDTTLPVTLDEMIYHTKMVVRGTSKALIIADMPFLSYQANPEQAIMNAGRLMKEGGAGAVKLEGGAHMVETVRHLVQIGIPVMAHVGLTPQSVHALGGFRVQGKDEQSAARIYDDALMLEEAGAFAMLLETIPVALAAKITANLHIPTIGIGAGVACDGQVQVFHDLLGLIDGFTPKHARRYLEMGSQIRDAIQRFSQDVQSGAFPDDDHSFGVAKPTVSQQIADAAPITPYGGR